MPDDDLVALVGGVCSGAVSSVGLVEQALGRAAETAALNAFAYLDRGGALAAAKRRDEQAAAGDVCGPLHGIPVTVKDLYQVEDMPTRAGSRAPLPPLGAGEAGAVARLRAAGAVILGKTNMVEVALGGSGENPVTGDVCNPRDPARQAGGSSSGSAVAVAAGAGLASLGSDTAGSVRIPAAFCGVVGFKPTFGLVPMTGALPLCPTCDHAGPLARSVRDAQVVFSVLAGQQREIRWPGRAPRLGVPFRYMDGALAASVRRAFEGFLAAAARWGCEIVDVSLPPAEVTWRSYGVLSTVEPAHVHRAALRDHAGLFSPRVRSALRRGLEVPAVDYLEARRLRRVACDEIGSVLRAVDALVLPTTPCVPPLRGSETIEAESGTRPYRAALLHLTVPFSLVGVPALSLPYGEAEGFPVSAQLVMARGKDHELLGLGRWIEQRLAWP